MAPSDSPGGGAPKSFNPMGLPPAENRICFCHGVSEADIREAIRAGAVTLAAIQSETCASTGCGGCQPDVEAILADELTRRP